MNEWEKKLAEIEGQLKVWFDKAAEEKKLIGGMQDETKKSIEALQKQFDAFDKKMVEKLTAGTEGKSVADVLKENEDVAKLIRDGKGRARVTLTGALASSVWEGKTITTPGRITPGVVDAERMGGIVTEARRKLTIRDVLAARPTTRPLVYWVKVNNPLALASPQVEASSKFENTVSFTTANSPVKTIATFARASQQAIDDFDELAGFLKAGLPYYVNREEERQLLSGDNTGENLDGLVTQATAFDSSLLDASEGWTRIDQIGAAIQQVGEADEVDPSFVVLNKRDWWLIRRTKDSFGRYILGDPQSVGNPSLWDLAPVPTNTMPTGTFLVGSGDAAAAEIRDRMEMQVDISYEDADNFTKNLVTIRAEKRMTLCVLRPASFIHGSFSTSPA